MTATSPARSRISFRPDFFVWAVAIIGFVSVWRFNLLFFKFLSPIRPGVLTMAFGLIGWYLARERIRQWSHLKNLVPVKLAMALCLVALAGIPLGLFPSKALYFVRVDFASVVIYAFLTAACVRHRADLERLMLMHVVGASAFSLYVSRMPMPAGGRLAGFPAYDANDFGVLLVMSFPLAVYFLRTRERPVIRIIAALALALFVVILVRTGSRGGFLGFIATGLYLLFRFKGIPTRIRIAAIALGVVTLAVAGSDKYWEMMSTIQNPKDDYNFTEEGGRVNIWKRGIGYMLKYPIAGAGLDNFSIAEGQSDLNRLRISEGRGWVQTASHNSFVQIGVEAGVTGLALFLSLLGVSIRSCMGKPRPNATSVERDEEALARALAGSLLGFCVAGFFVSHAYSPYLYAVLGLAAGLQKLRAAQRSAPIPRPLAGLGQ